MVTRKQFLQALRSGEYVQGVGKLRTGEFYGNTYCCLGLYCEMAAPDQWHGSTSRSHYAGSMNALDSRYAIRDFGHTLGLHDDTPLEVLFKVQTHMIHINDGLGDFEGNPHTFEQIADWIENDLHAFVEELFGDMVFTRV